MERAIGRKLSFLIVEADLKFAINKQWNKKKKFKAKKKRAVFAKDTKNVPSAREKEFGMKALTTAKDAVPAAASAGVPNVWEAAKLKPNRFEKL